MKNLSLNEFTVLLRYFVMIGYDQKIAYNMLSKDLLSEEQLSLLNEMDFEVTHFKVLIEYTQMFRKGNAEIIIHRKKVAGNQ